ncbi:MAG TPA: hypothetical protein VI933_03185 [archaeon]|nr:hypothetical protein [archaeon]
MSTRALHPVPMNLTPEEITARMNILGGGRMVRRVYLEAAPPSYERDGVPMQNVIVVEYHDKPKDFRPQPRIDGIDYVR